MFWTKAAQAYKASRNKTALKFYTYSLSFPTSILPSADLSNLQANVAWCHLKEKGLEQARKYASMSPVNLRSLYIQYKVAILDKDTDTAVEMLRLIGSNQHDEVDLELREGLLSLAVTDAFSAENRIIAVAALESLCSNDATVKDTHLLRCLVRLKYAHFDEDLDDFRSKWADLYRFVELAARKIKDQDVGTFGESVEAELEWWARTAWQLGLESCEYT